jgi:hypothetical protein
MLEDRVAYGLGASAFILAVLVYLALNIVGTIYYTKLNRETSKEKSIAAGGLATVILGWIMFPLLNLYSPIAYSIQ